MQMTYRLEHHTPGVPALLVYDCVIQVGCTLTVYLKL